MAAAGAGAGAAVIPFLLAPGLDVDILNLSPGGSGIKTFKGAIEGLSDKFDGTQSSIAVFLEAVARRADKNGWRAQMTIPVGAPAVDRDLVTDYGVIAMTDVKQHATTWIGTSTRAAQNAYMLYEFIMDSLTIEFRAKVILRPEEYRASNAAGTITREDGPSLLKYVVSLTYIDTVGSSSNVREELMSMSTKFAELKWNVELFNEWIRAQTTKLAASGEVCQDLLHYLWKAYPTAPDQDFRDYIALRKSAWQDGAIVTSDGLMAHAESRYATLVLAHTWAAPSEEQRELVALTAKILELNKQVSKSKQPKKEQAKKGKEGTAKKKKGTPKKGKSNDGKFAWKNVPPREGSPTTKQVEGKTYNFCPNHGDKGMWVIHDISECKARRQSSSSSGSANSPQIQRALNMSAIVDTFADEEQSGEEDE
jgi:hypothetical protein